MTARYVALRNPTSSPVTRGRIEEGEGNEHDCGSPPPGLPRMTGEVKTPCS
jgi:hypothetical protein